MIGLITVYKFKKLDVSRPIRIFQNKRKEKRFNFHTARYFCFVRETHIRSNVCIDPLVTSVLVLNVYCETKR